jgi:hypothetical protein
MFLRAVAVLLILFVGCGRKHDPKLRQLGDDLARSIVAADEDLFVRLHVRSGDMSPSGNYWLATRRGGTRPDAAWEEEVRRAFGRLTNDMTRLDVDRRSLRYEGIRSVDVYLTDNDADRSHLSRLVLRFSAGKKSWDFRFDEGMLSQRGWVITGEPAVTISSSSPSA